MPYLNEVLLKGHLGRDVEIRYLPSGATMATVSLATARRYEQDGEWTTETTWHNLVGWGRIADQMADGEKGDLVTVRGRIAERKWTDKDGRNRKDIQIVVTIWQNDTAAVTKRGRDDGQSSSTSNRRRPEPTYPPDDDVPF